MKQKQKQKFKTWNKNKNKKIESKNLKKKKTKSSRKLKKKDLAFSADRKCLFLCVYVRMYVWSNIIGDAKNLETIVKFWKHKIKTKKNAKKYYVVYL